MHNKSPNPLRADSTARGDYQHAHSGHNVSARPDPFTSMKTPKTMIYGTSLLVLIASQVLTGCGKKDEPPSAPAPMDTTAPAAQAAPRQATSVAPTGQPQPDQWMTDAQNYQSQGDYDKAAQSLIAIQRQQQYLNEQQAAAYWQQMRTFQSDLASRVASGDPSAKAAAERLRAYGTR